MKKILLFLFISVLLVSCNFGKLDSTFILDNPTELPLKVVLDEKVEEIEPFNHKSIKLETGEHIIELADGRKVYFTVYYNSRGGIINPTGAPYIFERIIYAQEGYEDNAKPMDQQIFVDGVEYYGPFSVRNDFIIDRTHGDYEKGAWEFNPYEKISETKNLGDMKVNIFTKVNGRHEFVAMMEEYYPELVGYYKENAKYYDAKVNIELPKEQEYEIPNFKNENINKYTKELIALDKAYIEAKDKKAQEKLNKDYKETWKNYVKARMEDKESIADKYFEAKNLGRGVIITKVE